SVHELVPEGSRAEFHARMDQLLAGQKLPIAEVFRLRSGQEIELEESLFPILGAKGAVVRIASIARDGRELARLRRATESPGRVGQAEAGPARSLRMKAMHSAAEVVAAHPSATELILGETGVGKSWLARRIHEQSPRKGKPLFEVNCASLDAQLVESELF